VLASKLPRKSATYAYDLKQLLVGVDVQSALSVAQSDADADADVCARRCGRRLAKERTPISTQPSASSSDRIHKLTFNLQSTLPFPNKVKNTTKLTIE